MDAFADSKFRKNFLSVLFIYVLVYKFADGLTIQTHGDPQYYHLAGAKIFLTHGLKVLAHDLQGYAQAGLFDALYVIPLLFTKNLLAVQLIAQEMHLAFSLFLGAFLFRRWIPNRTLGILGAISLMTISRDFAFFIYAKNDGVVALTTLIAAYWIYKRKPAALIGLGLGLIPSIKMSGLICSFSLALIYCFQNRKNFKAILVAGGVSILTLLPMMVKNFYFTANPVFPVLLKLIPGTVSVYTQSLYLHYFSEAPTISSIVQNFQDLFLGFY